jgi:hypothetical protein
MRGRSEGDDGRRKQADRRTRPRFDIVGELRGSLETVLPVVLRNVSTAGVLIESAVPLPVGSVQCVVFRCDDEEIPAQVHVRHVTPAESSARQCYAVGLEFIAVHPVLVAALAQWARAGEGGGVAEA